MVWPMSNGQPHHRRARRGVRRQGEVGKLDVDANRVTAGRFSVRSIPSILYFKDGELVDAVVGAYPKKYLEEKILEYV